MILYILRHAAVQGNRELRYVGTTDESILPDERERLQKRRELLTADKNWTEPGYAFVSPLIRCRETASLLFPETEQTVIPEFREIAFGRFENKNYRELTGDPAYQAWIDSGGTMRFPGGESRAEFQNRCLAGFDRVMQACRDGDVKKAAMVVHGGTVMSILSAYGRPAGDYYSFQVHPGCGYRLEADPARYKSEGIRIVTAIG